MKITLKDVAETAGVSTTTASLVLSGKGRISDSVRQAVHDAAEQLGYNRKKKSRQGEKSPTVGILVSIDAEWAMVWWFIRPIIAEIERNYRDRGENSVVIPISADIDDNEIIRRIQTEECRGVFSLHYGSEYLLSTLEDQGIPVVVIMNGRYQEKYHCILADDFQGAYEGTKHLLRLGHRDILYVDTERIDLPVLSTDRFYGFIKALDEMGVEFDPQLRISCDIANTSYFEAMIHAAFTRERPPTAVFAIDDDVAIRVIKFLSDMGFRVPEEVSVIAPGDLLNYANPHIFPITTLRINTQMMGGLACEMMSRLTDENGDNSDIHVLKIKQQLVQRGSTRPNIAAASSDEVSPEAVHRARFLSAFSRGGGNLGVPRWLGASREFIHRACRELSVTEEEFRAMIGDDLRWIEPDPVGQGPTRHDAFGIERRGTGYGQPTTHPLKAAPTIRALNDYPWPDPEKVDLGGLQQRLATLGKNHAVAGGPWSPFWHDAIDLVSLETLACLMYDDPVFVETLLNRIVDYYVTLATRYFEEAGDRIDLFFLRNDFGSQTGPLISPEHFRKFIQPCLERFTQLAHRYDIRVMLHSSGGILPLIPLIIESGFDALHALQPDCPGMQSNLLKRSFGGSIVLSGGIDARNIMRKGTPAQVREQVRGKLEMMSPGGGYIAAPSTDAVTEDVPVENILAMYETIREFE